MGPPGLPGDWLLPVRSPEARRPDTGPWTRFFGIKFLHHFSWYTFLAFEGTLGALTLDFDDFLMPFDIILALLSDVFPRPPATSISRELGFH